MGKPRIRHIAINVQDREKVAEYYVKVFGLEEKARGANGTIYLSDGFVDLALICNPKRPWGIRHFGLQVESVKAIEEIAQTPITQAPPESGVYGEFKLIDLEGNQIDVSEEGWPV
jgi:catechol-2,3-dioxygenase